MERQTLITRPQVVDAIISSHLDSNRRTSALTPLVTGNGTPYRYLVATNAANQGVFLVWSDSGRDADLTESIYEAITEEAERAGLADVYHVYSRRSLVYTDDVIFHQVSPVHGICTAP